MYKISKSFDFCYGHTVFSQDVNAEYAGSDECPCQRIHGHQGKIAVQMNALNLDKRGFVIDFKELNFIKKFINENLDHRFIISIEDPNFERMVGQLPHSLDTYNVNIMKVKMGERIVNPSSAFDDSFFIVNFNPTSEGLSKWIFNSLERVIAASPFQIEVESVTWSETPKTQAVYTNQGE